jgi:hypothetical protein
MGHAPRVWGEGPGWCASPRAAASPLGRPPPAPLAPYIRWGFGGRRDNPRQPLWAPPLLLPWPFGWLFSLSLSPTGCSQVRNGTWGVEISTISTPSCWWIRSGSTSSAAFAGPEPGRRRTTVRVWICEASCFRRCSSLVRLHDLEVGVARTTTSAKRFAKIRETRSIGLQRRYEYRIPVVTFI